MNNNLYKAPLKTYNSNELLYFLDIFLSESNLNIYINKKNKNFIQICKIYRHYGETHKNLIKKVVQKSLM